MQRRAAQKRYYRKHKDKVKKYQQEHPEKWAAANKKWRNNNKEQSLAIQRKWRQGNKLKVIEFYGGVCACCGESTPEFLCLDHINGGGNTHRKSINIKSGTSFYIWIIQNGYPDGFQTLCYNCNCAKGFFGGCPHILSRP